MAPSGLALTRRVAICCRPQWKPQRLPVVEAAAAAGTFNTLLAAVEASGLGLPSGVTVFAPTDDAFAAALEALGLTAEELLADVSVLSYHVVPMAATSDVVVGMGSGEVPTINGAPISVEVTDSGVVSC